MESTQKQQGGKKANCWKFSAVHLLRPTSKTHLGLEVLSVIARFQFFNLWPLKEGMAEGPIGILSKHYLALQVKTVLW